MNEIIKKEATEIITPVDEKTIMEYLDTTGLTKSLLPKEKAMFVNMARLYGLNPFKREIYCTVYGEGQYRQCSIVTGYEVYLKRAERIGKLDGWQAQITGSLQDGTLAATVTIWRKDWTHPFTHTAFYTECVQTSKKTGEPNAIWRKMPSFMVRKVAIAQAFRLCFSDEFGGDGDDCRRSGSADCGSKTRVGGRCAKPRNAFDKVRKSIKREAVRTRRRSAPHGKRCGSHRDVCPRRLVSQTKRNTGR